MPHAYKMKQKKLIKRNEEIMPFNWIKDMVDIRPRNESPTEYPCPEYCLIPQIPSKW